MMNKLVGLGMVVGIAVAVPAILDRNPDLISQIAGPDAQPSLPPAGPASQAAGHASLPQSGRSMRVQSDGRGHYVTEFRMNGRPVEAMIDTGASVVAINRSTARRIGVDIAASDFRHEVSTANGTTRAAIAMIDEMQLGSIGLRDIQAVVLEDEALSHTLVGMSFLNRLRRFSAEAGELILEQ